MTSGVAAAAAFMSYAVRGRSSRIFGESYYHGDRNRPVLALTFDDGPSESTKLLRLSTSMTLSRHVFHVRGKCPSLSEGRPRSGGARSRAGQSYRFACPSGFQVAAVHLIGPDAANKKTIHETTGAEAALVPCSCMACAGSVVAQAKASGASRRDVDRHRPRLA